VWLIDPIAKTLEVHALGEDRRWRDVRVYEGDVRVHAAPFAEIELELAALWPR
jgi:Uma2 family endonuclease